MNTTNVGEESNNWTYVSRNVLVQNRPISLDTEDCGLAVPRCFRSQDLLVLFQNAVRTSAHLESRCDFHVAEGEESEEIVSLQSR